MRLALIPFAAILLLAACSPKSEPAGEAPLQIEETSAVGTAAPPEPPIDPGALDLSKIALAMRIPSTFRAYDTGAYLQINVLSPRLGVDIAENFDLVPAPEIVSPYLESEAKDGYTVWTYATRPEDAARLAELSAELSRLKREAPGENELAFGAVAPGCWNEPEQTPGSLARTLYIRVVPEEDFQVLVPEQVVVQGQVPGTESFWGACKE